jgi:hypothetical protein
MTVDNTSKSASKDFIDLTDLSDYLNDGILGKKDKLDKKYNQIIEEVVFLCGNRNFIRDIVNLRQMIMNEMPGITLPVEDHLYASHIRQAVYCGFFKVYKKAVKQIIKRYKILPQIYWKNVLKNLKSDVQIELIKDGGIPSDGSKAYFNTKVVTKTLLHCPLELLDLIIFTNKPFCSKNMFSPYWADPKITRGEPILPMFINPDVNDDDSYLYIGFPPYATSEEMQGLIKKQYDIIQKYREKHLPLLPKRDHRKDNLPKMIDAYMLSMAGKSRVQICRALEEKYGPDLTFEAVDLLIRRFKDETKRFE